MELETGSLAQAAADAGAEVTEVTMEVEEYPPTVTLTPLPLEDATLMAIADEGARIVARAEALVITDTTTAKLAVDDLGIIRGIQSRVEKKRLEYVRPVLALQKEINQAFADLMAPIKKADGILTAAYGAYLKEEERKEAEQREIVRLQVEAAEKAKALRDSGGPDVELVQEAIEVEPAPIHTRGDSGALASRRKNWKARITSVRELAKAALSEDGSVDWITGNQPMLDLLAKQREDTGDPIPGVEFYNDGTFSVRR